MTNEEAILMLERIMYDEDNHGIEWATGAKEAFEMAISSLKKQDAPEANVGDTISRQAAIDAIHNYWKKRLDTLPTKMTEYGEVYADIQSMDKILEHNKTLVSFIKTLPSAHPELTDDRAIKHLQSTGWMQNHDKEMYEMGLRERLADDSGSYDSLIPSGDTILRQAAIDAIKTSRYLVDAMEKIIRLPSAQPEPRWIPVSERLPEAEYPVIVTWMNNDPASYYQYILGKHYTGVAHYKNNKWYWYSSVTEDVLMEYGKYDSEEFDEAIEVITWMPLPEPYKGES